MKKKRTLITGGAGFIGSLVTKLLYQEGLDTLVLDNLSSGDKKAVPFGSFIQADLRDKEELFTIVKDFKPDAVLHFAAKIDVGESVAFPLDYYENNSLGSLNLLEAITHFKVPHFIFSSTAAIYGVPKTALISEENEKKPINPYGKSKLFVEEMLEDMKSFPGFSYVSLRYFNAAGGDPEGIIKIRKKKETNLIPIVLRNILEGKKELIIFGDDYPTKDGTCIRDYIHIQDLAKAHLQALQYLLKRNPSNVFNLGTGQGFSVKEVGEAIQRVTKVPLKISIASRRAGDPPILVADPSKAKKELMFEPQFLTLDEICLDAWKMMSL